ncbi:PaaI family thioesterase [Acidipila sp. EB88]|uniref:PaaI family thioesterase n=1 Tax=Acidipila sp. EB88 TaxID=2305226 RepID=UPI00131587E7|nr:PaaI family thioesterase [Acidipila sp. EB88]
MQKAPVSTFTPLSFDDQHNCFGCGAHNRIGLRLRFFVDEQGAAMSTLRMPRRFQGPHGFVHGGIIAAVLDEAMSKAIHASREGAKVMALTRKMETEYLRPTPLGAVLTLRGQQDRVEGRKHFCSATLSNQEGQTLARGTALFIAIERQAEHKH